MENRLKELRKKAGVSQEELSKKSGVARTVISGIESGRTTVVTSYTLSKIANALDLKITDIFF